ncbi:MAG: hypothetical protein RMJ06_06840 [Nitrososphaerota archaeon]|nr:hypothetical protein [Nitrososphaerota archaeon]
MRRSSALSLALISAGLAVSPFPPEGAETILMLFLTPILGFLPALLLLSILGLTLFLLGALMLRREVRRWSRRGGSRTRSRSRAR